jgi:hypothetical protein
MTKEQERQEFDKLYSYIKTEILNYPDDMALPKHIVMRLKGLRNGQFIVNKSHKTKADYPYSTILLTFKFCKQQILNALTTKKFTSEQNKINYIMAIIENNINDVVLRLKAKEKSEKMVEKTEIVDYEIKVDKNNSVKKSNTGDNQTFNSLTNDLW